MEFDAVTGLKSYFSNGTYQKRNAQSSPIGPSRNPFDYRTDLGFGLFPIRFENFKVLWQEQAKA